MSAASFDWFPDWSGQTCIVVAGGPSAKNAGLDRVKGKARCIVVNEGYRLAPWADALYAADSPWWTSRKGCCEFKGLKIASGDEPGKRYGRIREIKLVNGTRIIRATKGYVASGRVSRNAGSNSGFHAIQIAYQAGAQKIILVGFDMRVDLGVHWHGAYPVGMNNPGPRHMKVWREVLDGNAGQFRSSGITVINASPISALENYPKMNLEDALAA